MRFEKTLFCVFKFQFFKNAVSKQFIFCDLVLNRTFSLQNRNPKRTLSIIARMLFITNHEKTISTIAKPKYVHRTTL
jgi:hypothetical protein